MLQLFRATQQVIFRYEIIEGPKAFETSINGRNWEMYNDTVAGVGKVGRKVCRVSVEETLHVRPQERPNSIQVPTLDEQRYQCRSW